MNGVWQSCCSPGDSLEPLSGRPYIHFTNTAVCPSGLGARLQSELRGFESRHGLQNASVSRHDLLTHLISVANCGLDVISVDVIHFADDARLTVVVTGVVVVVAV